MLDQLLATILRALIKRAVGQKGSVSDLRLVKLYGMIIEESKDNFETDNDAEVLKKFQADCHRQALELF